MNTQERLKIPEYYGGCRECVRQNLDLSYNDMRNNEVNCNGDHLQDHPQTLTYLDKSQGVNCLGNIDVASRTCNMRA